MKKYQRQENNILSQQLQQKKSRMNMIRGETGLRDWKLKMDMKLLFIIVCLI